MAQERCQRGVLSASSGAVKVWHKRDISVGCSSSLVEPFRYGTREMSPWVLIASSGAVQVWHKRDVSVGCSLPLVGLFRCGTREMSTWGAHRL
jgi:hypothetical protein